MTLLSSRGGGVQLCTLLTKLHNFTHAFNSRKKTIEDVCLKRRAKTSHVHYRACRGIK